MKLIKETGELVNVGDVVKTFRGEEVTITGWPKNGRNRVYVKNAEGGEMEYFPSVVNCKLVAS